MVNKTVGKILKTKSEKKLLYQPEKMRAKVLGKTVPVHNVVKVPNEVQRINSLRM
jgi:glycerol-3-phosphate cytidylyltransferase-like family protein